MNIKALRDFIADPQQSELTLTLQDEQDVEYVEDPASWFSQAMRDNNMMATWNKGETTVKITKPTP